MPGTRTVKTSPAASGPIPDGVPVEMMSPRSSVMTDEMNAISWGIAKRGWASMSKRQVNRDRRRFNQHKREVGPNEWARVKLAKRQRARQRREERLKRRAAPSA